MCVCVVLCSFWSSLRMTSAACPLNSANLTPTWAQPTTHTHSTVYCTVRVGISLSQPSVCAVSNGSLARACRILSASVAFQDSSRVDAVRLSIYRTLQRSSRMEGTPSQYTQPEQITLRFTLAPLPFALYSAVPIDGVASTYSRMHTNLLLYSAVAQSHECT